MTFFYPIKLENYTGRIKSRFSEWYPYFHICSGGRETEVAVFLFTCFFSGSPGRIRTYYISLERYFQGKYTAVGIVGNGSVGTELSKKQFFRLCPIGGG